MHGLQSHRWQSVKVERQADDRPSKTSKTIWRSARKSGTTLDSGLVTISSTL